MVNIQFFAGIKPQWSAIYHIPFIKPLYIYTYIEWDAHTSLYSKHVKSWYISIIHVCAIVQPLSASPWRLFGVPGPRHDICSQQTSNALLVLQNYMWIIVNLYWSTLKEKAKQHTLYKHKKPDGITRTMTISEYDLTYLNVRCDIFYYNMSWGRFARDTYNHTLFVFHKSTGKQKV